jgi:hypothetical protein
VGVDPLAALVHQYGSAGFLNWFSCCEDHAKNFPHFVVEGEEVEVVDAQIVDLHQLVYLANHGPVQWVAAMLGVNLQCLVVHDGEASSCHPDDELDTETVTPVDPAHVLEVVKGDDDSRANGGKYCHVT